MGSQLDRILKDEALNTKQKIEKLLAATFPYHETTDHRFEAVPEYPAFCKHCGWINPDIKDTTGCTHTVWEHALIVVRKLTENMLETAILSFLEHVMEIPDESEGSEARRKENARWN